MHFTYNLSSFGFHLGNLFLFRIWILSCCWSFVGDVDDDSFFFLVLSHRTFAFGFAFFLTLCYDVGAVLLVENLHAVVENRKRMSTFEGSSQKRAEKRIRFGFTSFYLLLVILFYFIFVYLLRWA